MKTNSTCCGGTASTPCDHAIAELPRYYPRQLITPDDLTLEQNYFRDRMRRHNRLLHGWGVVCGALVCPVTVKASDGTIATAPWQVQVQEGYALGPYGDEIILDCARTFDLRTQRVSGVTGESCVDVPDPWCSQVFSAPTNGTFCVAIKYKQSQTRPVRVQPVGCGCDDTSCEYSRWHDGYEISALPTCPTTHQNPPDLKNLFQGSEPTCPDCPTQPWVALAIVNVDGNGNITSIDNCSCRRLVLSSGKLWWQCSSTVTITKVADANGTSPVTITADGKTTAMARVTGANLDPKATYTLGNGVTIHSVAATGGAQPGTSVDLTLRAVIGATPGNRTLTVVSGDCSVAIFANAVNVTETTQGAVKTSTPAPKQATSKASAPADATAGTSAKGTSAGTASAAADKSAQPSSTKGSSKT